MYHVIYSLLSESNLIEVVNAVVVVSGAGDDGMSRFGANRWIEDRSRRFLHLGDNRIVGGCFGGQGFMSKKFCGSVRGASAHGVD